MSFTTASPLLSMSWKGLKHIPVYAAYALLFKHKGAKYNWVVLNLYFNFSPLKYISIWYFSTYLLFGLLVNKSFPNTNQQLLTLFTIQPFICLSVNKCQSSIKIYAFSRYSDFCWPFSHKKSCYSCLTSPLFPQ